MAQAFGVVHVFVTGKPPKHGLPWQAYERMATVLAGARIGQHVARNRAEAQGIVEFAIGQQSGIGGDPRAVELKLYASIESEPERGPSIDSPVGLPAAPPLDPK